MAGCGSVGLAATVELSLADRCRFIETEEALEGGPKITRAATAGVWDGNGIGTFRQPAAGDRHASRDGTAVTPPARRPPPAPRRPRLPDPRRSPENASPEGFSEEPPAGFFGQHATPKIEP
jgi:hypothetical protein